MSQECRVLIPQYKGQLGSSFEIGPSANRLRGSYELLFYSGNGVNSRNVTREHLPPLSLFLQIMFIQILLEGKVGKLDRGFDGMVDEAVDTDRSSQPVDQSKVTASIVPPVHAAVPSGRAGPAGGQRTAAAASLRGATIEEIPSVFVQDSACASGEGAMSTPFYGIDQGQRVQGHWQP